VIDRLALALVVLALGGCRPEPQAKPRSDEPIEQAPQPEVIAARVPVIEEPPAEPEQALGVADVGIFADLDDRVQISLAAELDAGLVVLIDEQRSLLLLYADGRPIKVYPLLDEGGRTLQLGARTLRLRPGDQGELAPLPDALTLRVLASGTIAPPGDHDRDGIPDPLDLNLGAIKTTLNADAYNQDYFVLPYPGGDVDRSLGACTDVIVRALRNAGVDLQVEVHEDIARAPRRYPMVDAANDDIDHRRVRTLLPWFRAHWIALDEAAPLQPGDVVFMDTIAARKGPDHIGILGDRVSEDGRLLVANNWTDGYVTSFMDLLAFVEVSDRFRMPPAPEHAGPISGFATQLLVVRSPSWSSFRAQARRFARAEINGEWQALGDAFPVVLGHAGLGWGRGLHGEGAPTSFKGPDKREGDGRSPAGVFAIGDAYGRAPKHATALRYQTQAESLRCVDDPASRHYAQVIDADAVTRDWSSAEAMRRLYDLAIVIEHNLARAPAGGSCIFLHAWDGPDSPVTGCTAMAVEELDTLAGWLAPGAVVVALPAAEYDRLSAAWSLPRFDVQASR
jgi:D-alanyl-D-alanine dipeptidase